MMKRMYTCVCGMDIYDQYGVWVVCMCVQYNVYGVCNCICAYLCVHGLWVGMVVIQGVCLCVWCVCGSTVRVPGMLSVCLVGGVGCVWYIQMWAHKQDWRLPLGSVFAFTC